MLNDFTILQQVLKADVVILLFTEWFVLYTQSITRLGNRLWFNSLAHVWHTVGEMLWIPS